MRSTIAFLFLPMFSKNVEAEVGRPLSWDHLSAEYFQSSSVKNRHALFPQVNIDSKTRDLTVRLLQAPSHTSLSHAQRRIYSLLDTDCLPRFLESTIYLGLLREAD